MVLSAVALGRALGFVSTHTHILSHHTCIFRSFVHLFNKAERNCILDLHRDLLPGVVLVVAVVVVVVVVLVLLLVIGHAARDPIYFHFRYLILPFIYIYIKSNRFILSQMCSKSASTMVGWKSLGARSKPIAAVVIPLVLLVTESCGAGG